MKPLKIVGSALLLLCCAVSIKAQVLEVNVTDFTSLPLRGRAVLQCDSPYYFDIKSFVSTNTIYFSNVLAGTYQLLLARPAGSLQYTIIMPTAATNDVLDAYSLWANIPSVLTSAPWTNWLGVYGVFYGGGLGLTNFNATNLTAGYIPITRFPAYILTNMATGIWWTNTTGIAGNGAGLTGLYASALASGTVPLARLSGITTAQLSGDLTNNTTGNAATATLATNAITATNVSGVAWQTNTIVYVSNVVGVTNETGAFTNLTLTLVTNTFYWLGR